ncbi:hypothetical protein D3OALGA1CA_2317 [Olavius algarvensis associated proteobacterium Delta 3]|nr:hypothetical protein D3OALGB2SA_219 [Olavius algarvensis associated proteobacterium Delta 3]CAB5116831.1 hypothetical protein D3OALGA1CA_2317 [Olavius algarvensis associated proteobacterium Delta 3]
MGTFAGWPVSRFEFGVEFFGVSIKRGINDFDLYEIESVDEIFLSKYSFNS